MKSNKKKEKLSSEKVKRLPKFYVLDAVIILLIVAVFLGIYFRYSIFDMLGNTKNQVDVEVSFSIKNIQDTTSHYIDIGDIVYIKDGQTEFGTILASDDSSDMPLGNISPASETFIKDGEIISVNYPSDTRINAEGRILCRGNFAQDGSFMLGGDKYLSAGQKLTVCTENVTVEITVLSIDKIVK